MGFDYQANLAKHGSQVDAAKGFGGKYGVQKERTDKVRGTYVSHVLYVYSVYISLCSLFLL